MFDCINRFSRIVRMKIKYLLLLIFTTLIIGCVGSLEQPEYPSAKIPSTAPSSPEQEIKCNPGETLICITERRISDRRFGRNKMESGLCSCNPDLTGRW